MQDKYKLNKQLQFKYENDFNFHKIMDQRKANYQENKAALAYQPQINIDDRLLQIFALQKDYQVYFYNGSLQPQNKSMTPVLALYLIKNFNPKFHKKYKFVFFNNNVQNKNVYYQFKKIFLTFPIEYFTSLDEFIFIKPKFSHKMSQWWTSDQIEKYFKVKSRYINDTVQLCPILNTNLNKLLQSLPRQVALQQFPEQYKSLHQKQRSLSDYRLNFKGQQRDFKQQKSFQNFVFQINNFFQASNNKPMQITDYDTNQAKLPIILQQLFAYFEQNPQRIKTQGLFRKSVSIDEQNQTLSQLMVNNFKYLKKIQNPHLIANLIKRFFAKLKTPIIPYHSFYVLMHDQGVTDKVSVIKSTISQFPKQNYFPLLFLFQFLHDNVLPQQKYTFMNANNLAICFAPCLLRSQKPSQLDLIYATKSSHIVKLILDNFEQIFGDKCGREQKIRSTIETQRMNWQQSLKKQIRSISSSSTQKKSRDSFFNEK